MHSIEFMISWIQNSMNYNNKIREQILLKLTSQYDVQKYFFIKKPNEINMY
jgi:hypothetical protein